MMLETSIIIRTKNEAQWLGVVLKTLYEQTYRNFEVVIVDSGSTDATLKIVQNFPTTIVKILPEQFSYPYALNIGVEYAKASKYLVILSAHSIPISKTWLADGIENFSRYEKIMGVYGFVKPLPGATFWDKFFMNIVFGIGHVLRGEIFRQQWLIKHSGIGVLGFTNAIILRGLWDQHHFDETYGLGGEDGEWAQHWFVRGYLAILDKKFSVRHSHNLGFRGWLEQIRYWRSLGVPHAFTWPLFRQDKVHNLS